jgi:predicted nucleic acid-binding Zn ribbon protein
MKTSEPKQLSLLLDDVMTELGIARRIKEMRALELWAGTVGKQIADSTEAERISGGKLVVRVKRAPWRNELIFLKKEIIAKLNKAIGEEVVKDIIFR